jgi:DNA-binding transcriptional ArsR family regulator
MLMPIFRSRHQAELLTQLLLHPDTEFSLSELARQIDVPLPTLQREAQRLIQAGLLRDRKQGRNRLVSANPDNPATPPLTQLLALSFGPQTVIAEEFILPDVEEVLIFGSWAARFVGHPGPPPNDIDVLTIGTAGRYDVYAAADRAQRRLDIPVNPVLCTPERWNDPGDDALINGIRNAPYTTVYRAKDRAA